MECRDWSAAVDTHVVRTRGWSGGERALQRSGAGGPSSFCLLLLPPDSSFAAPTILTVASTHPESQVMGCLGPHGWYTFAGGQVRSGDTEMGVRQAKEARGQHLRWPPVTHRIALQWHYASCCTRPGHGRAPRRPPGSGRAPQGGRPGNCH